MKVVDSHCHGLEPLLDVVPLGIVELTAQLTPNQGSWTAASIDEKPDVSDVVFLREAMEDAAAGPVSRRCL